MTTRKELAEKLRVNEEIDKIAEISNMLTGVWEHLQQMERDGKMLLPADMGLRLGEIARLLVKGNYELRYLGIDVLEEDSALEVLRTNADTVQEQMADRFNKQKKPTWGDIANWIELLNPSEETATAIIARFATSASKKGEKS